MRPCGRLGAVTPDVLRGYFATLAGLSLATRARKQAAVASFLGWAMRQDRLDADPMAKVARVRPRTRHRAACRRRGSSGSWPRSPAQARDHLLFRLLYATGLRIGEALGLYAEDVDLTRDDERLGVLGKGGRRRTVLLDDPALVRQLRAYLQEPKRGEAPACMGRSSGRPRTAQGGRWPTSRSRRAGWATAPPSGSSAPSTNCGTPTRRRW